MNNDNAKWGKEINGVKVFSEPCVVQKNIKVYIHLYEVLKTEHGVLSDALLSIQLLI